MRKVKKLTAFMLLAAFVFAFIVPVTAMAEGTGSITVENPQIDSAQEGTQYHDYTAYKIFDVVYDMKTNNEGQKVTGDHYSYTINGSTNEWFTDVQEYANDVRNGLELTQVNDSTVYNVKVTDAFSAPAFAKFLNTKTTGKTGGSALTVDGGKATATGLDLGYYFVSTNSGSLCNLTTTDPTVTIHDKNDVPFDKTVTTSTATNADKASAGIGETVTYTITGKVPDTTGFTEYTYKITDTMSQGLTFNKDVAVKIGETVVTDACTVTNKPSDTAATGFELTIPVKNYQEQVGAVITVTYSAKVNEKALVKVENNNAVLNYSNDPTDVTSTTPSQPEIVPVYNSEIVIDKYATNPNNENDKSTKLEGAKFKLYRINADGAKKYYKYTEANATEAAKVEWVAEGGDEKVTDVNGAASFRGLANGTYYLEETEAPKGYNLLKEPFPVEINGADATVDNLSPLSKNQPVANNTGAELPETGGIGTTIFYVVGAALVVGAGVLLVTKKRMTGQR